MTSDALRTILEIAGWGEERAHAEITGGTDPILPTPFRIGETSPAAVKEVPKEFTPAELVRWSTASDTPVGRLHHLGPVMRLSETPPHTARPSVPLGYHELVWPARAA